MVSRGGGKGGGGVALDMCSVCVQEQKCEGTHVKHVRRPFTTCTKVKDHQTCSCLSFLAGQSAFSFKLFFACIFIFLLSSTQFYS